MIQSIKHKGLKKLFLQDDASGINPEFLKRIRKILALLNIAESVDEIGSYPGYRLHQLKGELKGFWSVSVSGNYRVTFRFESGNAYEVDLIDYH